MSLQSTVMSEQVHLPQVPLSLSFYTPIVWNWTTICDVSAGAHIRPQPTHLLQHRNLDPGVAEFSDVCCRCSQRRSSSPTSS
jgi:hypothetical protein